ncbi:coiled-coil domain-containing protein 125 [Polymixia lowei]
MLHCELEVTHRYLEGKYEALKILQGQAILDKATSHTRSLLQKSEERAKALEKEVNGLQWEITFNQVQLKKMEQSWEQKFNRIYSENKGLSDSLEERVREVQELRSENAALSQRCLELLSMLSVKEQKTFQGTKPPCNQGKEVTVLELAVLGACQCPGIRESCPCAQTAAASRKQLLQLRQELDAQRRRREEALMVADAFRIAFEQQLKKRSDHFLLLAEAHALKSRLNKPEGKSDASANRRSSVSVAQRLRGLLPSGLEVKMSEDPIETLYRLLDLLNDKEEALAHQRKVSFMLARKAEELEKQLQIESKCQPQEPSDSKTQPQEPSDSKTQPQEPSDSKTQPQEPSDSKTQPQEPSDSKTQPQEPSDSKTQPQEPSDSKTQPQEPSDSKTQPQEPSDSKTQPHEPSDSKTHPQEPSDSKTQPQEPSDSKTHPQEPSDSKTQPQEPSDSKTHPQEPSDSKTQPQEPSDSKTHPQEPSDSKTQPQEPSDSKTQPQEPSDSKTQPQEPSDSKTHPQEPSDSKTQPQEPSDSKTQPQEPSDSKTQPQEPSDSKLNVSFSDCKLLRQESVSDSDLQPQELQADKTSKQE